MRIFLGAILLTVFGVANAWGNTVGFVQDTLYSDTERPLNTSIWFPAQSGLSVERIAENPAFYGTDVVPSGQPLAGKFPLVVISHGYRGNWRNQNWLATTLAQNGYVVVSIDHPGTTTFNQSAELAAQWWERPGDLSRLLDWLLTSAEWAEIIDESDITAIGHSLGGWTVMALAGAQFDRSQMLQECTGEASPLVCGLASGLGLEVPQEGEPLGSLKDDRINRVVSMDLGLARGFARQSLRDLTTPTLILAAGIDTAGLPQADESGFLARYIPRVNHDYIVYPDATHFSFMQLCKPGAVEMIEEEDPGDGIVCQDGNDRPREELHQAIAQDIMQFIQQP